ncbi:MAG: type II secretion system protein [Candidatus Saccharibacteria bacterium]
MNNKKKQNGFTIIEVVLVLAIAGLIFMMVFIALPALQRSQRDMQRKSDLDRFEVALASYESNNRNALPSGMVSSENTSWLSFLSRYITPLPDDKFTDPSGTDYILVDKGKVNSTASIPAFDAATPNIYITIDATCNGEDLTMGQGSRKVSFQMKLEGSGIACINN